MTSSATARPDEALGKGAVDDLPAVPDTGNRPRPDALASQLGHRDQDDMLKDGDTDYPEPDARAEHSGR